MLENPLWIKIEQDVSQTLVVSRVILWPKIVDIKNEVAIPFLSKLKIQQDILFTSSKFKFDMEDPKGSLWIVNSNGKLLCLWLPDSFSTISQYADRIFNTVNLQVPDLSDFVSKFHAARKTHIELFSAENAKRLELPPLWLFPKSVIKSQFLPKYSAKYTELIDVSGMQLLDFLRRIFSNEQEIILKNIPFEKELLAFHILHEYLQAVPEIERRFTILKEVKSTFHLIDVEFYDLLFLYHCTLLKSYPEHIIQELQRIASQESLDILNVYATLYLADAAMQAEMLEVAMQEYYKLLNAVEYANPYILARANIGIAQINYNIGNYLYADIAYSLAFEKIKLLNDYNMLSTAELELTKIRVMQVKNLFHYAFYDFNNNLAEVKYASALYPIFQGIIQTIDLLSTNRAYFEMIRDALLPNISTIEQLLKLHHKYLAPHINFDLQEVYSFIKELKSGVLENETATELRKQMIRVGIPKVEKIVLFTNDGRQIGEVIRKENTFKQLGLLNVENPLFAPALSSIASFIKEAVTKNPSDEIESIDLGRFVISFYRANMVIIAVYSDSVSKQFQEDMQKLVDEYETENYERLSNWKGSIQELTPLIDYMQGYFFYALD